MSLPGIASRSPIGLDCGASTMKAAQLCRTRSGWRLAAVACVPRIEPDGPLTAADAGRLVEVMYSSGFAGIDAVVGAPLGQIKSAVLDLPPRSSGAPVEQICQAEVARMFRLSPGSYEMHAWELPTASERAGTMQMTVDALESTHAEALLEPLDALGVEVAAIDLAGEALCRSCAAACTNAQGLTVLVDLGWSGLGLVVFRGSDCVYSRWLRGQGLGRLAAQVSTTLAVDEHATQLLIRRVGLADVQGDNLDTVALARLRSHVREYAEGLLHQVLGSVAYVLDRFHGESVTSLRLSGGGATIPQFGPYLAEMSGLDVEVLGPRRCGFECTDEQDRPALMTAIGHAMWRETP